MEQRIAHLESELKKLQGASGRRQKFEGLLKTFTLLGAVVGFLWGVIGHYEAVQQDFRKTFWEKRYSLYTETTNLASTIAHAKSLGEVATERKQFWVLYTGKMSILEDKSVYDAMVNFGTELSRLERNDTSIAFSSIESFSLRTLSYRLARACRESLKTTWEPVDLDDIPEDKNQAQVAKN